MFTFSDRSGLGGVPTTCGGGNLTMGMSDEGGIDENAGCGGGNLTTGTSDDDSVNGPGDCGWEERRIGLFDEGEVIWRVSN